MKLQNGLVLSVYNTENACRIICSGNPHILHDFRNNSMSLESNEKEFARAMYKGLQQIAKMGLAYDTAAYKDEDTMPGAATGCAATQAM